MYSLFHIADDFEAVIRILKPRPPHSRYNGVRWEFAYASAEFADERYMIFPEFVSSSGERLPTDVPLAVDVELPARLFILFDESRDTTHRSRISLGTEFFCLEGPHRVATGRVTCITGLTRVRDR